MVSLLLAALLPSISVNKPTAIDRDVILAYLKSKRSEINARTPFAVVQPKTSKRVFDLSLRALKQLSEGRRQMNGVVSGILRRNTAPVSLETLSWPTEVVFFDLLANQKRQLYFDFEFYSLFAPGVRCYEFTLPGYSEDLKTAAMDVWVGPTGVHAMHELVVLTLRDKKWSIHSRQWEWYP